MLELLVNPTLNYIQLSLHSAFQPFTTMLLKPYFATSNLTHFLLNRGYMKLLQCSISHTCEIKH